MTTLTCLGCSAQCGTRRGGTGKPATLTPRVCLFLSTGRSSRHGRTRCDCHLSFTTDRSQEVSGMSPRKRLSGQLFSRPPKSGLFSPRKLSSPNLLPMPHAEPATDKSQDASGAWPRKRLSGQLFSRPLKPPLFSPRKLVSPHLWTMFHAEPRGIRSSASPLLLRLLLPTYHPLAPSTSNGTLEQGPRVWDEKLPSV